MGTFTLSPTISPETIYLYPEANGCHTDFSQYPASNQNWDKIDDDRLSFDDDSTYVYTNSTDTEYDLYEIEDTTITENINYVKVRARGKSHLYSQDDSGIYKIIITDNNCSDISKSGDFDLTTSYSNMSKTWTQNPRTASDWTVADINNLEIGIECDSPEHSINKTLTVKPNAQGTYDFLDHGMLDGCSPHYAPPFRKWEAARVGNCYYIRYDAGDVAGSYVTDTFEVDNHTTETGTITKVVIFVTSGCYDCYSGLGNRPQIRGVIHINGSTYYSSYKNLNYEWKGVYSFTFINNPDTGVAWTWNDIDNMEVGFEYLESGVSSDENVYLFNLYAVVYYEETTSPEIRTTSVYAEVNYGGSKECTLTKPNEISTSHKRNVKMLNFWNGEREVYDLSRSTKNMVMKGIEWEDACTKIQCVRDRGLAEENVTISGLYPSCFNGTYKIKSFGWNQISKTPEVFEWMIELEDTDL